jgi:hypothetical protein
MSVNLIYVKNMQLKTFVFVMEKLDEHLGNPAHYKEVSIISLSCSSGYEELIDDLHTYVLILFFFCYLLIMFVYLL